MMEPLFSKDVSIPHVIPASDLLTFDVQEKKTIIMPFFFPDLSQGADNYS